MAYIRNMVMLMELLLDLNVPLVHILNNESGTIHCADGVIISCAPKLCQAKAMSKDVSYTVLLNPGEIKHVAPGYH